MGKCKEMQIQRDNEIMEILETPPTEISRQVVMNLSDGEFYVYRQLHAEEIISSDYLMCMFNWCGICPNCAEAKATKCYIDTPYIHRENCQCEDNANKRLVELIDGRNSWDCHTVTICEHCDVHQINYSGWADDYIYNEKNDVWECREVWETRNN